MTETALKNETEPDLDETVAQLTSDDFQPGIPTERLQAAIDAHGGAFRSAVASIRTQYDAMIARAGKASHEEMQKFLANRGLGDPMLRRRVENAAADRVRAETVDDIRPKLETVISDLVREEEARRAKLKERERQIEAEQEARRDQLAQDMKAYRPLAEFVATWFAAKFEARQEIEPLEKAKEKAADELRDVQEGEKPQNREVWSDGTPIHSRDSGIAEKRRDGQIISRVVRQDPWPEFDAAQRKSTQAAQAYSEAASRMAALDKLGYAICGLPQCSISSVDELERTAAMALGAEWHRAGEVRDDRIDGDRQFRTIIITSGPKAKKTGGLFK